MGKLFVSIGAGPGMSASTAMRFAQEGYDVVLAARNVNKLAQTAESIRTETGRTVEVISLDAANLTDIEHLAARCGAETGVVHYNAAAMHTTNIFETSAEAMTEDLQVNIGSALATIRFFAPYMEKQRSGTILLTGGGYALQPSLEHLTLSVGKAGTRCMTQALFSDFARRGIHIATLTVFPMVSANSDAAEAAAAAYWKLHSEAEGQWTWEATLR